MSKDTNLNADKLRQIAAEIEEKHKGQFLDLRARLEREERMKLTPIRNGSGGSTCRMAGITATSTSGDHGAVTNWANAARRKVLALDAELPLEATAE